MKHTLLILLLSLSSVVQGQTCEDELRIQGVLLARSASSFDEKTLSRYHTQRRHQLSLIEGRVVAQNPDPAAQLLARLMQYLAESSWLTPYLKNPISIHIRFVQNDETFALPMARMDHGVFLINQEMVDLLQTDDELAVLAAEGLLRHTLAHDLLKDEDKAKSKVGRLLDRVRNSAIDFAFDEESEAALFFVMESSGFTPWAISVLRHNILQMSVAAGHRMFPVSEAEKMNRLVKKTIDELKGRRTPKPNRHPERVLLDHLKALLRGEG
jgi:hypothetical protein